MKQFVLVDKEGRLRTAIMNTHCALYSATTEERVTVFTEYEAALKIAKEHGNLDVAEVRVITRVRTTTHKHQNIDYCLED